MGAECRSPLFLILLPAGVRNSAGQDCAETCFAGAAMPYMAYQFRGFAV